MLSSDCRYLILPLVPLCSSQLCCLPVIARRTHQQIVLWSRWSRLVNILPVYQRIYSNLTGSKLDAVGHQRQTRAHRGSFAFVCVLSRLYIPLTHPIHLFIIQRTGVHSVADVFCLGCNERLGWFYHKAADHLQKYKEGTYILFEYISSTILLNFTRKIPSRAGEACKGKCVDLGRLILKLRSCTYVTQIERTTVAHLYICSCCGPGLDGPVTCFIPPPQLYQHGPRSAWRGGKM